MQVEVPGEPNVSPRRTIINGADVSSSWRAAANGGFELTYTVAEGDASVLYRAPATSIQVLIFPHVRVYQTYC